LEKLFKKNINLLLTSDMKHHDALDAFEAGVTIIDAGHFETRKNFHAKTCRYSYR